MRSQRACHWSYSLQHRRMQVCPGRDTETYATCKSKRLLYSWESRLWKRMRWCTRCQHYRAGQCSLVSNHPALGQLRRAESEREVRTTPLGRINKEGDV